ncbi:hypothetical protein P5673_027089 [Acropora cervicornis]|uniref:Uncharacterized protein n=1 Tax=Acropora cervicornis TaxID=6130 RepID=A0AAD9PZU3_ACRCE|nr:hypothetical protein P5673_027089 [Acropora cervicornis]
MKYTIQEDIGHHFLDNAVQLVKEGKKFVLVLDNIDWDLKVVFKKLYKNFGREQGTLRYGDRHKEVVKFAKAIKRKFNVTEFK